MSNNIQEARFGGGQSFSGSGYSSGGVSGGSYYGGYGGGFFVGGVAGQGFSGIGTFIFLFTLLIVASSFIFSRRNNIGSGYFQKNNNIPEADLTDLTTLDPAFSGQRFLDHVQSLFFKFQQAWTKGDLTLIRAYLTQSMYTRLSTQIDELNGKNESDILEDIAIGGLKIIDLKIDNNFVYLVVQIDAEMKDYTIEKTSGRLVEGDRYNAQRFTEYWEFIRSKDIKSDYSKGFSAQTCPNCGAPIQVNEFGQCSYCKAAITSGSFDWVLDQIYQAGEYTPNKSSNPVLTN